LNKQRDELIEKRKEDYKNLRRSITDTEIIKEEEKEQIMQLNREKIKLEEKKNS